ncbi:MAG: radical SAM protein [Myxococcota bacterium]|nr:radical SAM protein [Myxococcota bacterium]
MEQRQYIDNMLAAESGTLHQFGKRDIVMVYPSPYTVGMASLGFQSVYRDLNALPDTCAERAFLPSADIFDQSWKTLLSFESKRPVGDFSVLAFSVAYELELQGLFHTLELSGIPVLREERGEEQPWIVAGGPLTFSNPTPLAPFADIIVMGEAEGLLEPLLEQLFGCEKRSDALRVLAGLPGFYIPSIHGECLPAVAKAPDNLLPATSVICTPHSALRDMFLIEVERGCSRGCTFCVMRRSTNGGMRLVSKEKILSLIPDEVNRVGLVGAAVSDHPKIVEIVSDIVDSGREIGLSSLRSDRLTPAFVQALKKGGYKTLTVASDGASERLRIGMEKKIRARHLLNAAKLAGEEGVPVLKVYMMIGAPGEEDADLDELVALCLEQDKMAGPKTRIAMGLAPFVAKRNTPLDRLPFAGAKTVERRIAYLRKRLEPRVELRATSVRWAWAEYVLAQGGSETGLACYRAWKRGGRFVDYKKELKPFDKSSEFQENLAQKHLAGLFASA